MFKKELHVQFSKKSTSFRKNILAPILILSMFFLFFSTFQSLEAGGDGDVIRQNAVAFSLIGGLILVYIASLVHSIWTAHKQAP